MTTASATKSLAARDITACNFRASGLLSNDSLRQMRSVHETLARMLSHSLDLSLGAPLEVKLEKIDQLSGRDFAALGQGSYLVPFGVEPGPVRVAGRFDSGLLFPLLDLLLGGTGDSSELSRELTEIDEELFRSVTELICAQLERVWKPLDVSVAPLPSIKPAMLAQMFVPEERVLVLDFVIRLDEAIGTFSLALPMTLASSLVRNSQSESARRTGLQSGSPRGMEQRLLSCTMRLSTELPKLAVPLGELALLREGTIVNLRIPAQTPVQLRIGQHALFEVIPVRRGALKAAQLVRARSEEE